VEAQKNSARERCSPEPAEPQPEPTDLHLRGAAPVRGFSEETIARCERSRQGVYVDPGVPVLPGVVVRFAVCPGVLPVLGTGSRRP